MGTNKAVLVTGGAGYIGSHTCLALAAAGWTPVSFDNFSTGHRWAVQWGPVVEGDLGDRPAIMAALSHYRVEAVVHFAASAYVGDSMREPAKYFRNNVINSLNLLEAMAEVGVNNIVFSSTCATYGEPPELPISESTPQRPLNPYGESKLFVERALKWNAVAHDLRWTALRYFNAAGADPVGRLGESHSPETHLVPLVIEAALGRRAELEVFGSDYPTADGTAVRDYVHVADLADAHVLALDRLQRGEPCGAFNLGTGTGNSVLSVIRAVEAYTGKRVPFAYKPRRPGDPPNLVASAQLAREQLGWRPQLSCIEDIVRTAADWHMVHSLRVPT